jgi:hypothetical protein
MEVKRSRYLFISKIAFSFKFQSAQFIGLHVFVYGASPITANGYVLAMVGHLKNVSLTFVQMPYRNTNVEFTTVSPTIANTMLPAGIFYVSVVTSSQDWFI